MLLWTLGYFLSFATASLAMDISSGGAGDEIINLDIGGQRFRTRRSTLCAFPDSPLGLMFKKDLGMKPAEMTDQGYFLDEDPLLFRHVLNYLRHETLPPLSEQDCHILREIAEKWLPPMLSAIRKPKTKKGESLSAMQGTDVKGKRAWFLFDDLRKRIVGDSEYGAEAKTLIERVLEEYNNRSIHKDLIYAWSGYGYSVFNLKNGAMIGEQVNGWQKHGVVSKREEFFGLHLIEGVVRVKKKRYICNFNKIGTFSAFEVKGGKKVLLDQEFETLEKCITALRTGFKT